MPLGIDRVKDLIPSSIRKQEDHATRNERPISQVSSNHDAVIPEKALAGKVVEHF